MHSTVVITYFTGHKNAAKGVKGGRGGAFIKGVKMWENSKAHVNG